MLAIEENRHLKHFPNEDDDASMHQCLDEENETIMDYDICFVLSMVFVIILTLESIIMLISLYAIHHWLPKIMPLPEELYTKICNKIIIINSEVIFLCAEPGRNVEKYLCSFHIGH